MDDAENKNALAQVLQQLQGRKLRLVPPGGFATTDIQPGRLTLYVDEQAQIIRVQLDPELPNG